MGNRNAKEREDERKMSQISMGLRTLRQSMENLNGGSSKSTLNSNEKEVWDVLRRSKKGRTRKQALSLLEDITDLRDKDRQCASARESILDNGAVESNSIIAGDVKKYDRNRQRDKNIEELTDIKHALAKLRPKVFGKDCKEDMGECCQILDGLMIRLDRLQLKPNSKLQQYVSEYRHCIEEYLKKLAGKRGSHDLDGSVISKMDPAVGHQKKEVRDLAVEQEQHLAVQDELAIIRAQVASFTDQCSQFASIPQSSGYKHLDQALRKLWDQLGGIKDERLADERDEIIGMIAITLKELNRKARENARSQQNFDQFGSLVDSFLELFDKIEFIVPSDGISPNAPAYHIFNDIQKRICNILMRNDCHLVKAKITPSLASMPMSIYLSQDHLPQETNLVYIDEESSNEGSFQRDTFPNGNIPNIGMANGKEQNSIQPAEQKEDIVGSLSRSDFRSVLDNLNFESIAVKLSVESFESNDIDKYNELDGRLIELLIALEKLQDECTPDDEKFRQTIKNRIKTAFSKLSAKVKQGCTDEEQLEHDADSNVHLHIITNIRKDLAQLKEAINDSYPWQSSSPNFRMLEAQLKYIIDRLIAIPSGGSENVEVARTELLEDADRTASRLNAQKFKSDFAGTEV